MAKTLMESIAEDESKLGVKTLTEGDEDGSEPVEPESDERDTREIDETDKETASRTGDGRRRGRSSRKSSGDAPQSEGGAPQEDGEASPRDSRGTRKDAGPSREDARKPVLKDEEDKPPAPGDHAAWAKLRREKRELEAKLRDKEKSPVKQEDKKSDPKVEAKASDDPEPNKAENPDAWREWKERQRDREISELRSDREALRKEMDDRKRQDDLNKQYKEGIEEFIGLRDTYIKSNPDYAPAYEHAWKEWWNALRLVSPAAVTDRQITTYIDNEILKFAGECLEKGIDPMESIYDLCIERFGYVPEAGDVETQAEEANEDVPRETPKPKVEKPSLKAIANTRKRSASPLMGPGQSGKGSLTKTVAADMTLGEMMDLGPEDWAALERMEA